MIPRSSRPPYALHVLAIIMTWVYVMTPAKQNHCAAAGIEALLSVIHDARLDQKASPDSLVDDLCFIRVAFLTSTKARMRDLCAGMLWGRGGGA